jgi:hypothetical protein
MARTLTEAEYFAGLYGDNRTGIRPSDAPQPITTPGSRINWSDIVARVNAGNANSQNKATPKINWNQWGNYLNSARTRSITTPPTANRTTVPKKPTALADLYYTPYQIDDMLMGMETGKPKQTWNQIRGTVPGMRDIMTPGIQPTATPTPVPTVTSTEGQEGTTLGYTPTVSWADLTPEDQEVLQQSPELAEIYGIDPKEIPGYTGDGSDTGTGTTGPEFWTDPNPNSPTYGQRYRGINYEFGEPTDWILDNGQQDNAKDSTVIGTAETGYFRVDSTGAVSPLIPPKEDTTAKSANVQIIQGQDGKWYSYNKDTGAATPIDTGQAQTFETTTSDPIQEGDFLNTYEITTNKVTGEQTRKLLDSRKNIVLPNGMPQQKLNNKSGVAEWWNPELGDYGGAQMYEGAEFPQYAEGYVSPEAYIADAQIKQQAIQAWISRVLGTAGALSKQTYQKLSSFDKAQYAKYIENGTLQPPSWWAYRNSSAGQNVLTATPPK